VTLFGIKRSRAGGEPARVEHPVRQLHRDMDRLFADFFGRPPAGFHEWESASFPPVNVRDTGEGVQVSAELPGMGKEDVRITLEGNALVIRGEKVDEKSTQEAGWYRRERSSGSFSRVIALPEGLDLDKVEARFDKGVLTIDIERLPETKVKSRKIEVKA
jgi:HSP20 family protein